MIKYIKIEKSGRKDKRFKATFYDKDKKFLESVDFGAKTGSTYIDHKDDLKRINYIKRHSKLNEDWEKPNNAGSLSRWILWEEKNLIDAIYNFLDLFKLELY